MTQVTGTTESLERNG